MPVRVGWHCFLVRAPTELGRLQTFGAESFDRPGVDEYIARLGVARALGVALGDMNALDPGALHQPRPVGAGLGLVECKTDRGGDVEQRLLDHPGHHAGIGAAAAHRGDAAGTAAAHVEHAFAQCVIRALRDRGLGVGVEAGPWFADRIDVVGVDVLAQIHQTGRRRVDREVDDHPPAGTAGQQRGEDGAVVVPGNGKLLEAQVAFVEQRPISVDRINDDEFRGVEADVPLQQRQRASADRAEADHHYRAVEPRMQRPSGLGFGHRMHGCSFSRSGAATPCFARRAQI